jgi:hypothetical protein
MTPVQQLEPPPGKLEQPVPPHLPQEYAQQTDVVVLVQPLEHHCTVGVFVGLVDVGVFVVTTLGTGHVDPMIRLSDHLKLEPCLITLPAR